MSALLDTNVLIHAVSPASPLHVIAAGILDRGLRQSGRYCLAPQNLVEFLAVATRPRFVQPALTAQEAAARADLLYRSRRLRKIYPSRGTVFRAAREGALLGITGSRWYDLFLAVTMRDAGVREIVTENVDDFQGFPFLRVQPLAAARP